MANCGTCGATMAHFENPSRDICPNEPHANTGNNSPARQESGRRMGEGNRNRGRNIDGTKKPSARGQKKEEKKKGE